MEMILRVLKGLAAFVLLALMSVTVLDVIGRYVLNMPLPGAYELTQLLLALLVFCALPVVTRMGGHVEVDLFEAMMSPGVKRLSSICAALVSGGMLAYFGWQVFGDGVAMIADGARTEALHLPMSPIAFVAAGGCLLAAVFAFIRGAKE